MTRDQEIVKQLQHRLKGQNWNPDGECGHWDHSHQPCCYYDKQGRLTHLHLCHLKLTQLPSEVWRYSSLQELYLWGHGSEQAQTNVTV